MMPQQKNTTLDPRRWRLANPCRGATTFMMLRLAAGGGNLKEVRLTHADFAQLLGVRRTTVTLVVGQLEAAGAIRCRRGP